MFLTLRTSWQAFIQTQFTLWYILLKICSQAFPHCPAHNPPSRLGRSLTTFVPSHVRIVLPRYLSLSSEEGVPPPLWSQLVDSGLVSCGKYACPQLWLLLLVRKHSVIPEPTTQPPKPGFPLRLLLDVLLLPWINILTL